MYADVHLFYVVIVSSITYQPKAQQSQRLTIDLSEHAYVAWNVRTFPNNTMDVAKDNFDQLFAAGHTSGRKLGGYDQVRVTTDVDNPYRTRESSPVAQAPPTPPAVSRASVSMHATMDTSVGNSSSAGSLTFVGSAVAAGRPGSSNDASAVPQPRRLTAPSVPQPRANFGQASWPEREDRAMLIPSGSLQCHPHDPYSAGKSAAAVDAAPHTPTQEVAGPLTGIRRRIRRTFDDVSSAPEAVEVPSLARTVRQRLEDLRAVRGATICSLGLAPFASTALTRTMSPRTDPTFWNKLSETTSWFKELIDSCSKNLIMIDKSHAELLSDDTFGAPVIAELETDGKLRYLVEMRAIFEEQKAFRPKLVGIKESQAK